MGKSVKTRGKQAKSKRQAARKQAAGRKAGTGTKASRVAPKDTDGSAARGRKRAPRPARLTLEETAAEKKRRAGRFLRALRKLYPDAGCALKHRSAYELLVATILSAQCTDERVNQVTPALFSRYPEPASLAAAEPAELEALIRTTGFYRNKARSLLGMAQTVCERFGGQIPDRMEDLLTLPGVARKTANCVLGTWFGRNEGIVVDTHVGRLAQRLGLLSTARDDKDAVRIEQDLMALFPRSSWTFLAHALIWHGRLVCTARKPKCAECGLAKDCPSKEEETGGEA